MRLFKKLGLLACLAGLLLLGAQTALAHTAWLSLPHHAIKQGNKCKIMIGWGHKFPLDDFLEAKKVTGVTLYNPEGKASEVPAINEFQFQTGALQEAGTYVIAASKAPSFFTRLEKGFARKPKTGLKGVKSCSRSLGFMKAVLTVGTGGPGDVSRKVGHDLELVPLDNPANLKPGDDMRIQVLLKGQPVTGYPMAFATYEGFNAPGFAYSSYVNNEGIFTLRILQAGAWLVHMKMSEPYPNPQECDVINYISELTFTIK